MARARANRSWARSNLRGSTSRSSKHGWSSEKLPRQSYRDSLRHLHLASCTDAPAPSAHLALISMGLFDKFRAGLQKTHNRLTHEIKRIVTRSPKLESESLEELE